MATKIRSNEGSCLWIAVSSYIGSKAIDSWGYKEVENIFKPASKLHLIFKISEMAFAQNRC